jgi:hypothetical protein
MNKICLVGCIILFTGSFSAEAWEIPPEPPRIPKSDIFAYYLPTFGILKKNNYTLYDNFVVNGSIVNIIQHGPNLNIYYGFNQLIRDMPFYPNGVGEISELQQMAQSLSLIHSQAVFCFYDLWQAKLEIRFLQNHTINNFLRKDDFDYSQCSFIAEIAYDARYTSLETYYHGMKFLYPQTGFTFHAGLIRSLTWAETGQERPGSLSAYGGGEFLFNLKENWVLSLGLSGESLLQSTQERSQLILSKVPGALQVPGEYSAAAGIAIRYLTRKGLFIESPAFWYINSFLFKFSFGFELGLDSGLSGFYNIGGPIDLYAAHAGPIFAIRMNGDLISVFKLQFAVSSSKKYSYVLSMNLGTMLDSQTLSFFHITGNP